MSKYYDMLSFLRKRAGLSQQELAERTGISRSAISMYETGKREPDLETFEIFADFYNVDMNTLTGKIVTFPSPRVAEEVVSIPIIGDVAAGYDHIANEEYDGEAVEIPLPWLHGRQVKDFFALRVKGDSMYPQYQNGDVVVVLKQATMNRSGEVGVVVYEDSNATLKKIEYVMGEDWMRLIPINPQFPPILVENEALEHCRVLGIPKYLIREVVQ